MRTWILAIVLVAACKGKDKNVASKQAAAAALAVPKVEVATVLAKEIGKPPFLVIVEDGGVRVASADSWADLDAGKIKISKKPEDLRHTDRYIREDFAMGKQPSDTVTSMNEFADDPVGIDLAALEDDLPRNNATLDDPPPPEEEDKPDDGEEESGGTGTAIALEEGKMGKKDSDRAEGQYKMKKNQEDPQLARQQAIEQARAAGILGNPSTAGAWAGLGAGRANTDGTPARVAQVQGVVAEDGTFDRFRTLIFITPTAKATKLIDAVRETEGAIAVVHGGKIRPLRLEFRGNHESWDEGPTIPARWIEVRVSTKDIAIEAVPDVPIETDLKQLAATLDKARKTRGAEADATVDVLVDADVDVQRLIDVLVALDVAGVRRIGMGAAPSAEELARRGHRIPTMSIGQPNAQGDLDKVLIRRVVRAAKPKVLECYTKALATNAELAGTVSAQFFITPKGTVSEATASGVDQAVASCVAGVLKGLTFPKPAGGGGVQVNYPFVMRP